MKTVAALAVGLVLVAAVNGSAEPRRSPDGGASDPSELTGTWRGSFHLINSYYYPDDANCVLQIHQDETFVYTCTPQSGSNNIAKPQKQTGTVVDRGNRVALKASNGATTTLAKSGDRLYGILVDQVTEDAVALTLVRDGSRMANASLGLY